MCKGNATTSARIARAVASGILFILLVWLAAPALPPDAAAGEAATPDEPAPAFRIPTRFATGGQAALVIDDANGRRVRNVFAQAMRDEGPADEPWNLRDEAGEFVAPGRYTWKTIAAPQLALHYGLTPYPNLQNFFPERMPWMIGHSGEHGWLSDHNANWACATSGDHVYFASTMAEAGSALIDCDLEGRRLWGRHDFGAWIGVYRMAADADSLYVLDASRMVRRLDVATRKEISSFRPDVGPHRRTVMASSIAAHDGKLCISHIIEPVFDNPATPALLDLQQCLPTPPDRSLLQLLRMEGDPPGANVNPGSDQPQGNGRLYLESQPIDLKQSKGDDNTPSVDTELLGGGDDDDAAELALGSNDKRRVAVIAFKQPVPLGSIVFPWPTGEGKLQFAALKLDAPYPPRPEQDADWTPFESSGGPGWNCVAAPPRLMTRAVRVLFEPKEKDSKFWRLEGLRLLNRRFASLSASARVRVNSGKVSPTGEWDAERTAAVAPDKPGIYVMDWKALQKLSGLAIKEIDGATAEIDVWQGPAPAEVPMDGPALDRKSKETGWRNVATYKQKRRISDYVAHMNRCANYMDGYVEFQETIETVAVRIRITEQWLDNNSPRGSACRRHDGRGEHGVHARNSYCTWLDPRMCKIMGVAALSPLGDDPPRDPLTYVRLEIWDGRTGKLIKELPSRIGWDALSFAPDGTLYAIEARHQDICRVDLESGKLTPVIHDARGIATFTIGPDNLFYVYAGPRAISVYDAQGRKLREIGKAGVVKPGPWDPNLFFKMRAIRVDRAGSLWGLEQQNAPRRIVQYKTDGTFVKELLGNTQYGGGGTIDRTNPSRAFYNGMEFEIDWEKHTSRLRSWLGSDFLGGEVTTQRRNGRVYLLTQPLIVGERQQVGVVYIFNEKEGTVRLAAAMGDAESFAPLRTSDTLSLLPPGSVPKPYEFLWFDRNGNGKVDAAEVDFKPKQGPAAVGNFDHTMGCPGYGVYYEMTAILPNGVPSYKRVTAPGWPNLRLSDGSWLNLHAKHDERTENFVIAPTGEKRWGYPAHGGVSGLYVPPWVPGQVTNQLCLVGHETAPAGDLGEFFVVSDNTGQWRIWTADGLLAGNVLYHQADPRSHLLGPPDAKPGTRLDPLTAKQEHFHGFLTRTEPDNRYFIIAGFVHMSIIEVKGLEKFRRAQATFEVTAADVARVRRREAEQFRQTAGDAAKLIARDVSDAKDNPLTVDGMLLPDEWPEATKLPSNPEVAFRMAYDDENLYLCWTGKDVGPLANDGHDLPRLFKTGACLDFQIGADEKADPNRTAPVKGDQRLLIAFVQGKPRVVLYQPVMPTAAPGEAWSTRSEAGGTTRFDRVTELKEGVSVAMKGEDELTVEAAIPLKALGLSPTPGMRLRCDWGILTSDDGHQVKSRSYWCNAGATGTADEPTEARLEPQYWGIVEFGGLPDAF